MGDHKVFHEELLELEQSIQSKLDSVRNTRGGQGRQDTLNQSNEKIKKARQVLHQLRVEVRSIGNQAEQADFEKKTKAHEKQIAQLNSLIQQLRSEAPAPDVEDPAAAGGNDRGRAGARKIAGNINTIQDDTIQQAQRAVTIVNDTEEVAGQASRKLREQTEEMKNIKEDLRTLDGNVKRAKREMQAFMRRMMSDRLILVLMFLVLCGIIAMVAVRLIKK